MLHEWACSCPIKILPSWRSVPWCPRQDNALIAGACVHSGRETFAVFTYLFSLDFAFFFSLSCSWSLASLSSASATRFSCAATSGCIATAFQRIRSASVHAFEQLQRCNSRALPILLHRLLSLSAPFGGDSPFLPRTPWPSWRLFVRICCAPDRSPRPRTVPRDMHLPRLAPSRVPSSPPTHPPRRNDRLTRSLNSRAQLATPGPCEERWRVFSPLAGGSAGASATRGRRARASRWRIGRDSCVEARVCGASRRSHAREPSKPRHLPLRPCRPPPWEFLLSTEKKLPEGALGRACPSNRRKRSGTSVGSRDRRWRARIACCSPHRKATDRRRKGAARLRRPGGRSSGEHRRSWRPRR